ncbi:eukaryotic cytochrome b561-domain-containing protein [Fennellomyces sp. T-0311]|nr:eukaryotic cytochrome b561-domain-containing protein [Fennellomyces sp. T-0311]
MANDERTPLIQDQPSPEVMKRGDAILATTTNFGLALFVTIVISVLVRIPYGPFTWHPIFAVLFIVFTTEGVSLLQHTSTAEQKKKGLRWHATVQSFAYLFAIAAFVAIVYNKTIHNKDQFDSVHSQFGLTVFIYLLLQVIFGLTIAYVPNLFGGVAKAKQLWKFHRMSGYLLLVLVWITALLGAHTDTMYNNLPKPGLVWGYYIALILVAVGIAGRVRFSKWGFVAPQK